jgi:glycosyltransferase involved in cell wall biosynthesis
MKVLLATDAFPPVSGGSGWSAFELARELRRRGHEVLVVRPRPGAPRGLTHTSYDQLRVVEVGAPAPAIPYVRNYFKNERLYAELAGVLADLIRRERIEIAHGQHVLTCLPTIDAAHRSGLPAVCTVRDYWPVCYWSDLLHTKDGAALCPACSGRMMVRCIRPRAGAAWPAAVPMIPYMRRNLRRKREGLARADAIIAVSTTIAADLRARAPEIAHTRLEIIPNPVNLQDLAARAERTARPLAGPYVLYLGKLAPNKGIAHLFDVMDRAALDWPLVVVGDGPDRHSLEVEATRRRRPGSHQIDRCRPHAHGPHDADGALFHGDAERGDAKPAGQEHRQPVDADSHRARQRRSRSICPAQRNATRHAARVLALDEAEDLAVPGHDRGVARRQTGHAKGGVGCLSIRRDTCPH